VAAGMMVDATRAKIRRAWRDWAGVSAIVVALIAPWFLYQFAREGRGLWDVMVATHVFQRFNSWLDPAHLHPWNYYFTELFAQMSRVHTFWLAVAGGVLVLARLLREQWPEGSVVVFWFLLPLALMSIGTSKLWHYAYPFLPAVSLAAGYALAWVLQAAGALTVGRPADWVAPVDVVPAALRARARLAQRLQPLFAPVARVAGRLLVATRTIGAVPIALYTLSAACVAVVLLMLAPVPTYESILRHLSDASHPLRSARDCMQSVREFQRASGQQPSDLVVFLPPGFFQHQYFLYFRHLGWDEHRQLSDDELRTMLGVPGSQRPVVLPHSRFKEFWNRNEGPQARLPPSVRLSDVDLLMPGPFGRCGE